MNKISVDRVEIAQDLGIEIHFKNNIFTLSKNNRGELVLSTIGDSNQLVILPQASNSVAIETENDYKK